MSDVLQQKQNIILYQNEDSLASLQDSVLAGKLSLEDAVNYFEKATILKALNSNKNNLTHSAKMLGITRRMIKYKIDNLIEKPQF